MEKTIEKLKAQWDGLEVPIAASIFLNGKMLSFAINEVEKRSDVTAHAEILAIQKASAILGTKYLNNCDMYVTLEPCAMCAQAISFARISRLYFAAYDFKSGGVINGAKVFNSTCCHYKPEVYPGIMEQEASEILQTFFNKLRLREI